MVRVCGAVFKRVGSLSAPFTLCSDIPIIARAMAPGFKERLRFADLAAHDAQIKRTLNAAELPRFSALCEPLQPIEVVLEFSRDAGGVRVRGSVKTTAGIECQRCLEAVSAELLGELDVHLVAEEVAASAVGAEHDVVVAGAEFVHIGELIEDELILCLPQQPCDVVACERQPAYAYPADADTTPSESRQELAATEQRENNPFRVLQQLKQNLKRNQPE